MVFIITGDIRSGKTSKLLSLYRQYGKGDGFYSQRVLNDKGETVGYDLVRLLNQETAPFIWLKSEIPPDWVEAFQFDKFSFSSVGLSFAGDIIDQLIHNRAEPLFIDEVGPVELCDKGFAQILKKVLNTNRDLCMTVRYSYIEAVVEKYKINNYSLVSSKHDINTTLAR